MIGSAERLMSYYMILWLLADSGFNHSKLQPGSASLAVNEWKQRANHFILFTTAPFQSKLPATLPGSVSTSLHAYGAEATMAVQLPVGISESGE